MPAPGDESAVTEERLTRAKVCEQWGEHLKKAERMISHRPLTRGLYPTTFQAVADEGTERTADPTNAASAGDAPEPATEDQRWKSYSSPWEIGARKELRRAQKRLKQHADAIEAVRSRFQSNQTAIRDGLVSCRTSYAQDPERGMAMISDTIERFTSPEDDGERGVPPIRSLLDELSSVVGSSAARSKPIGAFTSMNRADSSTLTRVCKAVLALDENAQELAAYTNEKVQLLTAMLENDKDLNDWLREPNWKSRKVGHPIPIPGLYETSTTTSVQPSLRAPSPVDNAGGLSESLAGDLSTLDMENHNNDTGSGYTAALAAIARSIQPTIKDGYIGNSPMRAAKQNSWFHSQPYRSALDLALTLRGASRLLGNSGDVPLSHDQFRTLVECTKDASKLFAPSATVLERARSQRYRLNRHDRLGNQSERSEVLWGVTGGAPATTQASSTSWTLAYLDRQWTNVDFTATFNADLSSPSPADSIDLGVNALPPFPGEEYKTSVRQLSTMLLTYGRQIGNKNQYTGDLRNSRRPSGSPGITSGDPGESSSQPRHHDHGPHRGYDDDDDEDEEATNRSLRLLDGYIDSAGLFDQAGWSRFGTFSEAIERVAAEAVLSSAHL